MPVVAPPEDVDAAPLVDVRGVSLVRDRFVALRAVSLQCAGGEVVALMGRNGAGKSTLLTTVEGSLRPTAGRVTVTGSVARAPQDPGSLLGTTTVGAQLAAHDAAHGLVAGSTRALLGRLSPDLGVDHEVGGEHEVGVGHDVGSGHEVGAVVGALRLDRTPADLSEGQRMCVALSQVLAREATVLLLDEPTRGLDYAAKARLAALLDERARAGCLVVVATHDVELAAEVATRVVVLADGEVVADGPARQVLADSPAFAPQVAKVMHPLPCLRISDVMDARISGATAATSSTPE
jgi:energy-coupling factor transport system ATP-binding protein